MTLAFYNDNDPYCAKWLRNLMAAGEIPQGVIDERDIRKIEPADLAEHKIAHWFAGIGGWPYALRLAGWEGPVWTASIPCQPLSSAGRRKGHADERHLWPAFYRLVAECRPPTIFGEQVASKDGREWLAGVRADLEELGYAVGAADLPAAGVGAPHIRQRLWWVADADKQRPIRQHPLLQRMEQGRHTQDSVETARSGKVGGLANTENPNRRRPSNTSNSGRRLAKTRRSSCWSDYDLISCADGKARRVESGTFPLAHGVPNRVGRLRAYGNAIVPQVAAEFVKAFMGQHYRI